LKLIRLAKYIILEPHLPHLKHFWQNMNLRLFFAPHQEKLTIQKFITWHIDNNWHIKKITWNSPIHLPLHRMMDPVHHPVQPSQRNNIAHTGCRDDISPPMSLILIFTWEEKENEI